MISERSKRRKILSLVFNLKFVLKKLLLETENVEKYKNWQMLDFFPFPLDNRNKYYAAGKPEREQRM